MTTANPTPQLSCFEQSFTSAVTYANPLQEAALQVTFVSPSGQSRLVSGFWDGDTTWRVRFSPDELGPWTFTTSCSDEANIGLHNQSGAFTCVPASGETRFERHGSLRLSDNCRFFIHADGTPFFWLADTAWSGPMFSTDEEWDYYLHQRVRQKFTAVQWMTTQTLSMPDGNLEGQMAFTGHERIAINPTFFQRLDAKLTWMNQAGLLAAPVLLWAAEWSTGEVNNLNPGFTLPEEQAILLARYMVARWAGYHVLWILPGDGHYTGPKAERWRRIGRAVFADLPGALVTLHPSGLQWYADDFRDESWLSLIGYQSSHSGNDQTLSWIVTGPPAQKWAETPPRPIINLEPCYEYHVDLADPDQRFDAHAVRRAIYWSLLVSPTAGVTYGGHGVWGWDDGTKAPMNHPKTGIPLPWQQALTMPAAEQMAHLAELFGSIEWWRLRPAPDLIANQPGEVTPARYIAAARSEAGDLALIYIPEDRLLEVRLEDLRADLSAQWFNPQTGERSDIGPIITEKIWPLETPAPGDWLLLLH